MKKEWNITGVVTTLECIDDNNNYQEAECTIDYSKLIKYLSTMDESDLFAQISSKKEFYIPIVRSENYDIISTIDLELECENLFIDIIDTRFNQLIENKKINVFTDSKGRFKALIEYDEKSSNVVFKDYEYSEKFKDLFTRHLRKKKIASILQ